MLRLAGMALVACAWLPLVTAATPRVEPATRAAATTTTTHVSAPSHLPAPAPAQPPAPRSPDLSPEEAAILSAIAHRTADASQADALFAPRSWYTPPPPPPPAAPAPAAAPTAPPLPFTFLGRYTDGNNATVYFVTRDDRVYDVKPGDVIDSIYSIEAVENGQLVFLYKPLNTRQPLALGDAP